MQPADETRSVRAGITTLHGCDGEGEDTGGLETGAFGFETGERPDKQRGANDEDEGESHLQSDDAFAQADTAEAGSGALAERADQTAAACVEGRSKAAQQAGGEAGEEGEGEQAKAEGSAQGAGGEV